MGKKRKIQVCAICNEKAKDIIKNSKYTYGDAVNYFARVISNSTTRLQAEIRSTKAKIDITKREQEKNEIKIIEYEKYLEKLIIEWESKRGTYSEDSTDELVLNSIKTIERIAEVHNCNLLEVDRFTCEETLAFQAKKCGMTQYEFEQLLISTEEE